MPKINEKLLKEIARMGKDDIKMGPDEEGLKVIPTGSLYLDTLLGSGGWPCGKVNVLVGKPSSGKSTLCLLTILEAQKLGKRIAYIDLESSFDAERAIFMGIDMSEETGLTVIRAKTLEAAGDVTVKLVSSGEVDLIIFDSVGGASIGPVEDGTLEDANVGRKPKIMSHFMMKLNGPLGFNKPCIIFIQQWRDSFNPYEPFVLTGGQAFNHAAQTIVHLSAKPPKEVKDGTLNVTAQVRKNKVSVAFKKGEFTLYPNGIIDKSEEIASIYADNVNYCSNYSLSDKTFSEALGVQRGGSWYTFPEEVFGVNNKFQGQNAFAEALKAEPDLIEIAEKEIVNKVMRPSIKE